jgi:hypothetical protein
LKKSLNGGTDILYVLIIVWFSSDTTPVKSNSQDSESNSQTQLQVISHILVNQTKFWYILGSQKSTIRKLYETPTHHPHFNPSSFFSSVWR